MEYKCHKYTTKNDKVRFVKQPEIRYDLSYVFPFETRYFILSTIVIMLEYTCNYDNGTTLKK